MLTPDADALPNPDPDPDPDPDPLPTPCQPWFISQVTDVYILNTQYCGTASIAIVDSSVTIVGTTT